MTERTIKCVHALDRGLFSSRASRQRHGQHQQHRHDNRLDTPPADGEELGFDESNGTPDVPTAFSVDTIGPLRPFHFEGTGGPVAGQSKSTSEARLIRSEKEKRAFDAPAVGGRCATDHSSGD